jgi:hypothetical protein
VTKMLGHQLCLSSFADTINTFQGNEATALKGWLSRHNNLSSLKIFLSPAITGRVSQSQTKD